MRQLLWRSHCGWCCKTDRGWRRWVQRLGVRWTTGICDRHSLCLYRQLLTEDMRRVRRLETRVQRLEQRLEGQVCTPTSA